MKKSGFSEGRIISAVKQSDPGISAEDICRKFGIEPYFLIPGFLAMNDPVFGEKTNCYVSNLKDGTTVGI